MSDARAPWLTPRGRYLAALAVGITVAVSTMAVVSTIGKLRSSRQEVRWLRARLADKREMVQRQRDEMAQVAAVVDRLSRAASAVREREATVRKLAHLEQSRPYDPQLTLASALPDGGQSLLSEDAARALAELVWLEEQVTSAGDSVEVLTALLTERRPRATMAVPTLWPVRGIVTSSFGARSDPWSGGREMHAGIDIQARYGFPVTASADGEVVFSGRDPGYGTCVVIDHGRGIRTLYGHLSAAYVRARTRVRRGEPVGALGASGRATGAHLHYEVRVAGQPVDPMRYLVN